MTQPTVISREHHAGKRWKRSSSYTFAAADSTVPLVMQEVARACVSMPVAFVRAGDVFQLVAVQGLLPKKNMWVAPDGSWLGSYVPAAYRGYPFVLANTQDERKLLCVREDSGLVSDTDGEPFFGEDGKPSAPVLEMLNFLEQVAVNSRLTARLCKLLDSHGLIRAWNIKVKGGDIEQKVQGLFCVDEAALNSLPIEAFDALRQSGALPMVYCHLLSMQHLHSLGRMETGQPRGNGLAHTESGDLDLEFLSRDGMIRYS